MSALPPGYTPPSYTPPPAYLRQEPEDKNGLAVAALVLGITSLVLGLIPGVGFLFGWLPGLLALIFGLISGIPTRPRRVMGIVGAGLAVLAGIVAVVWIAVFAAIGSSSSDSTSSVPGNIYSAPSSEPKSTFVPPAGFKQATDEVYYKWGDQKDEGFWTEVQGTAIAPDGCSSLWMDASVLDKDGAIVSTVSDFVTSVPAGEKVRVKFTVTDDDFSSIRLSKVTCY